MPTRNKGAFGPPPGGAKELGPLASNIRALPVRLGRKELTPGQTNLELWVDRQAEPDGIGMGVLRDGTAFLTGRGLARLVGIENLHIRTISQEWNETISPPRTARIKAILAKRGIEAPSAYIETSDGAVTIHAFPDAVCLAVLEYYAFDAARPREAARDNYRLLAGRALRDLIYSQVGYDPTGADRFRKWHERVALNHQSAPRGYFSIFNEAATIIYQLITAGAEIGEHFVVDISIGQHWAKHWRDYGLEFQFGDRESYPHSYPDDHPQAFSNPQTAWCYPLAALGYYREWLQDIYLEGGKFKGYLEGKVKKGDLPPSIAELALAVLVPEQIPGPAA